MKKPFEYKAKRLYSICASMFFMLAVFVVPAFAADGDPLAVVNNLSDFIFSLIRADRKSTRLNSSHWNKSRMPSSA